MKGGLWRIVSKRKAHFISAWRRRNGAVAAAWLCLGAAWRHPGTGYNGGNEIKRRRRGGNKSKSVLASAHVGISSGVGRRLKA
jgi:hypothetical protein